MTKLEDGETYVMKVEALGNNCIEQGCDSLKLTNYGDLFDFNVQYTLSNIDSFLNVGIVDPVVDHSGHRWKLSYNGNPNPPDNYNVIYNDSIKIRFKLSNNSYYQQDGAPLVFDTILTHVGVRIADIE